MTEIKVLELMDAIQQTQKTADDMWRVLREVLEEQRNAQQSVQSTVATEPLEDSPWQTGIRRGAVISSNRNSG